MFSLLPSNCWEQQRLLCLYCYHGTYGSCNFQCYSPPEATIVAIRGKMEITDWRLPLIGKGWRMRGSVLFSGAGVRWPPSIDGGIRTASVNPCFTKTQRSTDLPALFFNNVTKYPDSQKQHKFYGRVIRDFTNTATCLQNFLRTVHLPTNISLTKQQSERINAIWYENGRVDVSTLCEVRSAEWNYQSYVR